MKNVCGNVLAELARPITLIILFFRFPIWKINTFLKQACQLNEMVSSLCKVVWKFAYLDQRKVN
jgi:hypothetical protein